VLAIGKVSLSLGGTIFLDRVHRLGEYLLCGSPILGRVVFDGLNRPIAEPLRLDPAQTM